MESQSAPSSLRAELTSAVDDNEIEVRRGDTVIIIQGMPNQAVFRMVLRELLQSAFGAPSARLVCLHRVWLVAGVTARYRMSLATGSTTLLLLFSWELVTLPFAAALGDHRSGLIFQPDPWHIKVAVDGKMPNHGI